MERADNMTEGDRSQGASEAPVQGPGSSGRMTLLLIAGIPVIVILASSWLWFFVANGQLDLVGALGTSNSGTLVQPPRLATDARWTDRRDEVFNPSSGAPRWVMVIPQATTACDTLCEQRLYKTRQIHQSLGKELGRVRRVLVSPTHELELAVPALSDERPVPETFDAYLDSEQRGMVWYRTADTAFGGLFPELTEQPDSWYLMDPNGWVMMRYDGSIDYKNVISDLKFLIKNSNG